MPQPAAPAHTARTHAAMTPAVTAAIAQPLRSGRYRGRYAATLHIARARAFLPNRRRCLCRPSLQKIAAVGGRAAAAAAAAGGEEGEDGEGEAGRGLEGLVCVCVRACVCACVCACVRVCVCARAHV